MVDSNDGGSRQRVISEAEFGAKLVGAPPQIGLFAILDGLPARPDQIGRKQYWVLQEAAHELETFLDNFGARDNKTFVLYAELVASVRNFAIAAHTLGHLLVRFRTYGVEMPATADGGESFLVSFTNELAECTRYLGGTILKLIAALRAEAGRLAAAPPPTTGARAHVAEVREFWIRLPKNLADDKTADGADEIAKLLNDFLAVAKVAQRVRDRRPPRGASLREYLKEELPEERARRYTENVHSLQSRYDTHVKPTQHHERHELQRLRGHVSLAYHLLEVVNGLGHFYERHEGEVTASKRVIEGIVPPDELLDQMVHFALRWAADAIVTAEPLVRELLPQFTQQRSIELSLPDGIHLHARPLNLIVRVVRKHGKPVELLVGDEAVSANSLMSLILIVGRHPQRRRYTFRGDQAPLDHLQRLFASGLGEWGIDKLPPELAYLRES